MSRIELFEVLKANIRTIVEGAREVEISESQSLMYDLGADSLEAVEVVSRTMKQLRVRVPRTEIAQAANLSDVLDLLERAMMQTS